MHGRNLPPIRVRHPHVVEHPQLGMLIAGTRVAVRRLWSWHSKGISVETLVRRYPSLGWAKILDALSFAHGNKDRIEAELDYERAILGTGPGQVIEARIEETYALASDRSDGFFAWLR